MNFIRQQLCHYLPNKEYVISHGRSGLITVGTFMAHCCVVPHVKYRRENPLSPIQFWRSYHHNALSRSSPSPLWRELVNPSSDSPRQNAVTYFDIVACTVMSKRRLGTLSSKSLTLQSPEHSSTVSERTASGAARAVVQVRECCYEIFAKTNVSLSTPVKGMIGAPASSLSMFGPPDGSPNLSRRCSYN